MAHPDDFVASARTFLVRVLPWGEADGWFNVEWKSADGRWLRQSFKSIDALLAAIDRLKQHSDVYVCMSSQAVRDQRHAKDARFLKSLFLDVDVKAGAFLTPVEALTALNAFRAAVGLPRPTLVAMTAGLTGGFHCHWALDRPLAKDEWLKLARALKQAAKRHAFAVDLNVIADAARVLRVPGTFNRKPEYGQPRPVILHASVVERDTAVDELAGPLQPYMNTSRAFRLNSRAATAGSSHPAMSQLFAGMADNSDLSGGLLDFDAFKDAVMFLTGKDWFHRPHYEHMRDLAWALGAVEIAEPCLTDDARAVFDAVIAATGDRDVEKNQRLYEAGLDRTRQRLRAGEEVVTVGTIFHWAHEQGWTAAPPAAPFATAQAIELAIVKAKAIDAYKLGRLKSRDQARVLLARFCRTVERRRRQARAGENGRCGAGAGRLALRR